jgi:hypothetical protein
MKFMRLLVVRLIGDEVATVDRRGEEIDTFNVILSRDAVFKARNTMIPKAGTMTDGGFTPVYLVELTLTDGEKLLVLDVDDDISVSAWLLNG